MPVLPSSPGSSLATLSQGMFNESANQRSTALAMRNVLFETQQARSRTWAQSLQRLKEIEDARKRIHAQHSQAETSLYTTVGGMVVGGVLGAVTSVGAGVGASLGGSVGSRIGGVMAGDPRATTGLATSLTNIPQILQQQRMGNQLFDMRETQHELDELRLNLMSDLVATPTYGSSLPSPPSGVSTGYEPGIDLWSPPSR